MTYRLNTFEGVYPANFAGKSLGEMEEMICTMPRGTVVQQRYGYQWVTVASNS